MVEAMRASLKRMIDDAGDADLAAMHKKLTRKQTNICAVQTTTPVKWRPKNLEDTRLAIGLLSEDVGLRVADEIFAIPPAEPNMKVVCAEVVERLRHRKGIGSGEVRKATPGLSVTVASVLARVVEECNRQIDSNEPMKPLPVIRKDGRGDAPSWGLITARGSGCSFNAAGKDLFTKALRVVEQRLAAGM